MVYDDHFEVFLTFDDTPITIPTSEEIESMKNSSDIASVTSPNGDFSNHLTKGLKSHKQKRRVASDRKWLSVFI